VANNEGGNPRVGQFVVAETQTEDPATVLTQLSPPLQMDTPHGRGWAHFVIDYGPEADLLWGVFLDTDGACWCVSNRDVRLTANWSLGAPRKAANPPSPMRVAGLQKPDPAG
jgi:hypothetical protein